MTILANGVCEKLCELLLDLSGKKYLEFFFLFRIKVQQLDIAQ